MYGTIGSLGYKVNKQIQLASAHVQEVYDESMPHAFQVLATEKSFIAQASSAEEKDLWMSEIQKGIDKYSAMRSGSGVFSPLMVVDSAAKACMLCSDKFTLIRRRHHCRRCGKLVGGGDISEFDHCNHSRVMHAFNSFAVFTLLNCFRVAHSYIRIYS